MKFITVILVLCIALAITESNLIQENIAKEDRNFRRQHGLTLGLQRLQGQRDQQHGHFNGIQLRPLDRFGKPVKPITISKLTEGNLIESIVEHPIEEVQVSPDEDSTDVQIDPVVEDPEEEVEPIEEPVVEPEEDFELIEDPVDGEPEEECEPIEDPVDGEPEDDTEPKVEPSVVKPNEADNSKVGPAISEPTN